MERPILQPSTVVINVSSQLSLVSEVRYHHTQLVSDPRPLEHHTVMVISQASRVPGPS